MSQPPSIDETSDKLESWLNLVLRDDVRPGYTNIFFPGEAELNYYVSTIDQRDESEIVRLLERLLMSSTTFPLDEIYHQGSEKFPEMYQGVPAEVIAHNQLIRRRRDFFSKRSGIPAWEGNTWVIDLLPDHPGRALRVLEDYIIAHFIFLHDSKANSLYDAQAVIRARYIGIPRTIDEQVSFLKSIEPRKIEILAKRLFDAMGYTTSLTSPSRDGGRDVIAQKTTPGSSELVQIECKRYKKKIGVPIIRQLLGVVSDQKATRGVQIGISGFTKTAVEFCHRNPQICLLSGNEFVKQLNEHYGNQWVNVLERFTAEASETGG